MRTSVMEGNLARVISRSSGFKNVVCGSLVRFPFPLSHREVVIYMSWMKLDGNLIVCINSVDEHVDYGLPTKGFVRGDTTAFYIIEPLRPGICSVTLYQKLDFGGRIPSAVVNLKIPYALSVIVELRDAFKRDDEVDSERRTTLAGLIERDNQQPHGCEAQNSVAESKVECDLPLNQGNLGVCVETN